MARAGRYFLREQPLHVIQRGNYREAIFFEDTDYERNADWLSAAATAYGCAIHAYVLMTDHVHLLVTPDRADSLPRMMQSLGRRYVRHVNFVYRRTGTLWEGRYRAAPIDSEAYFLACCRYIELNPVRAGMATHPREYSRSSWRAHALGVRDKLVTDHPLYRALGRTAAERQKEYRALFRPALDPAFGRGATRRDEWRLGSRRRTFHAADRKDAAPTRLAFAPRSATQKLRRQTTAQSTLTPIPTCQVLRRGFR
jgi:putative transposase